MKKIITSLIAVVLLVSVRLPMPMAEVITDTTTRHQDTTSLIGDTM